MAGAEREMPPNQLRRLEKAAECHRDAGGPSSALPDVTRTARGGESSAYPFTEPRASSTSSTTGAAAKGRMHRLGAKSSREEGQEEEEEEAEAEPSGASRAAAEAQRKEHRRTLQLYIALEDFLRCCLQIRPEDRSTVEQLRQHAFLAL